MLRLRVDMRNDIFSKATPPRLTKTEGNYVEPVFQVMSFRAEERKITAGTGTDVEEMFQLRPQAEYTARLYYGKAWSLRGDDWRMLPLTRSLTD